MDYQAAHHYILHTLPAFEQDGKSYKPGLERIQKFCDAIGNPHHHFPVIHVGGTNGKGSTCHMLSALLQEAGYKVGLHVSPQMRKFTERATVNGKAAPDDSLGAFILAHQSLIQAIGLSYFELGVAYAFDHFAKEKVDIAIVEVGLGGTFDATNIVTPLFSLITNISADHLHILGPTLRDVAKEKAGIIKHTTPVIISQRQDDFADIFIDTAQHRKAPLLFASDMYCAKDKGMRDDMRAFDIYHDTTCLYDELVCDLAGQYQRHNLPGIFAAITLLRENNFTLNDEVICRALSHVCALSGFSGRWQIMAHDPLIVADGAHNVAGIAETLAQIHTTPYKTLYAILGCVKTKNPVEFLSPWPPDTQMIFAQAEIPRAMDALELANEAKRLGFSCTIIRNVNDALTYAQQKADKDDMIFIGGSLYLLSELTAL